MHRRHAVLAAQRDWPGVRAKACAARQGRAPFGGDAFYEIYETADGRHVVLGGSKHKFVENLLNALGRPDLIQAQRRAVRAVRHEPAKAFLREVFATRTRDEWEAWSQGATSASRRCSTCRRPSPRPQVAARGMLWRDAEGNLHIGNPIRFAQEPAQPDPRLPALGEHTQSVLAAVRRP